MLTYKMCTPDLLWPLVLKTVVMVFLRINLSSIAANPACMYYQCVCVCADGCIQWMWNEWKDGKFIGWLDGAYWVQ